MWIGVNGVIVRSLVERACYSCKHKSEQLRRTEKYIYLSLYYYIINIVNTKMEFSGTCDVTMWLCCIVGNVGAKFWKAVHWSSIAHL